MATNKAQRGSSVFLPEELIREILLRVPPRHLLCCRIICKAWRCLATDHAFILDHDNIHDALMVHASCDGLLLLGFRGACFVCNPAMRQGARLRPLRDGRGIAGFYKHAASAEYRVLYHRLEGLQYLTRYYYVLTLGSQEARTIGYRTSSAAVDVGLRRGLLHGSLHWPPQSDQDENILVFDPAAESFSWIAPPLGALLQDKD